MKKQILIIMCLLCSITTFAQTSTIVDKKTFKELKKQFKDSTNHKISKVTLETEVDGFSYYVCRRKDGYELLLISLDRHIIADVEGMMYQYVPTREEGWHTYAYLPNKTARIWTPQSNRCFIYYKKILGWFEILNEDGSVRFASPKRDGYEYDVMSFPYPETYYLEISKREKDASYDEKKAGLYTLNGEEIYPMEYDGIHYENFYYDFPFCTVWKKIDKTNKGTLYGGRFLDPENHAKYGVIPCEFEYISRDYKTHQPEVKVHDYDDYELYNPNKIYNTTSRDLGEQYYKQQNYDKVIEYYANAGIEKPWAKFYSGLAWHHKADAIYGKVISIHWWAVHENNLNTAIDILNLSGPVIDLNLADKEVASAKQLLESYQNSGDTEFTKQTESYLYRCNSLIEEQLKRREEYKTVSNLIQQREQAITAEQEARRQQQEARRQQQAAFWGALLQGFADALLDATEQSVSTPTSTHSSYSAPATSSYSSSSSSSSSSSLGGNGGSGDAVAKAKAKTRISELKNQIRTYEGLLRDAEAFETKCRAEKSNFLGQAIKDVNNYKKKLKDLNDEMNNLKSKYGL